MPAGCDITRSVSMSSQVPKLSQERKGHGSSLALAALELAEKEKELMASISSFPGSGEGLVTGVGRLLKMASVDRDFEAGSVIDGPATSGEEREATCGEEYLASGGRLADRRTDLARASGATPSAQVDGGSEFGRRGSSVVDRDDDRNYQIDDERNGSDRQRATIREEISEIMDRSSKTTGRSPRNQMRQVQGFVQDRKSSTSPLASNDVDVAVRCGFRPGEGASNLAGGMGDPVGVGCVRAEVVFQRHFAGHPTMIFVGVLEGHGADGREMMVDLGRFLPETLEIEMTDLGLQRCSEDVIKLALVHACEAGHARLLQGGYAGGSGVTATFGLVAHDKAYVANVGKGRCVLVSERMLGQSVEFERVSSDADAVPSTPSELERILKCGGVVGRFEDGHGIPYGSLRIFREGSRTSPGVTSSRALGNAEALACGVVPEPVVTEYTLSSRNSFFIWGSEGMWDAIGDEDASRVVSQYAKRRIPGLTSADVLSLYAQSASRSKKSGTQEAVNDVAVVVVDLREHIVPAEMQMLSEEETARLQAARSNEEACRQRGCGLTSVDQDVNQEAMAAAFARVKTLCELDRTKEIEFCDRTSRLTQMMRGGSGDVGVANGATAKSMAETVTGPRLLGEGGALNRLEGSMPARHGGLPIIPQSSFERASFEEWKVGRSHAAHESSRGLSLAFVPSQAIGVPSTRSGRKANTPARGLKDRPSIDDELRPIRKVGIQGSRSMANLKSSDSLEEGGVFSQQSQSLGMHDVWSLSERAFSPHSSEGLGRANSLLLEHTVGLCHEGKVRRGVPASFKSMSQLRLSSDSESEARSWSRANSLEEDITLGFEAPNSPLRHINVVPTGSFGSGRASSLLASSSYRNLRRQRSSSVSNLQSLAEDGDAKQLQRKSSNAVHVVKDIHKFFN